MSVITTTIKPRGRSKAATRYAVCRQYGIGYRVFTDKALADLYAALLARPIPVSAIPAL